MKNLIKIFAAALLSLFFISGLYAQKDSSIKFDGIDISLSYCQNMIKKDLTTGKKYTNYEVNDIYGISSVIMKNDILQIPLANQTLKIDNITSVRINTGRNRAVSTVIGAAVGLFCGSFAGLAYGLNVKDPNAPSVGFAIFAGIFTICGVTGYLAAPMSYEEVSLKYHKTDEKKDIMIKSFNKSKMQDF